MMIKAALMTSKMMSDEVLFAEDNVSAFDADVGAISAGIGEAITAGVIVLTAAGAALVGGTDVGVSVGAIVVAMNVGTGVAIEVDVAAGGAIVGVGVFVAGGG